MKIRISMVVLISVLVSILLAGCTPTPSPGPCTFTANTAVTAYRLPEVTSNVFGTVSTGDNFEILARTADGWVGFDPGIAQAGNIGLAHHRWVQLNATVAPSCLADVNLVTLADVQADVDASNP
jgi:hypothetical protein